MALNPYELTEEDHRTILAGLELWKAYMAGEANLHLVANEIEDRLLDSETALQPGGIKRLIERINIDDL